MCYHNKEVSTMEQEINNDLTPEETGYTPRPKWQRYLAWIGLVVFVLFMIMYYINIFRGGA